MDACLQEVATPLNDIWWTYFTNWDLLQLEESMAYSDVVSKRQRAKSVCETHTSISRTNAPLTFHPEAIPLMYCQLTCVSSHFYITTVIESTQIMQVNARFGCATDGEQQAAFCATAWKPGVVSVAHHLWRSARLHGGMWAIKCLSYTEQYDRTGHVRSTGNRWWVDNRSSVNATQSPWATCMELRNWWWGCIWN